MRLDLLPFRLGGAAENMAVDFLLLQRYPDAAAARFRTYGWHRPAFTFGYSQALDFVRTQLPAGESPDLCRRPTGGGVVDHREDWTYALVIPRGHPLEDMRATKSYREVHEALAASLRAQGVPALTQETRDPAADTPAGVCFERAEVHDVIHSGTGAKIAGAAQKRNKRGLLFQGSLWRPAAESGGAIDWDRFGEDFTAALAILLGAEAARMPWPEFAEGEVEALTEQYASPEWHAHR
jgi:lipoate-protein ligase A